MMASVNGMKIVLMRKWSLKEGKRLECSEIILPFTCLQVSGIPLLDVKVVEGTHLQNRLIGAENIAIAGG
jgi:hypothetical protein